MTASPGGAGRTPIGDIVAEVVSQRRRRNRVRETAPQPVLPAPVPLAIEPVRDRPETSAQEETLSPVSAALAAVQHQAANLERDATGNPLAVVITARHVGKSFTSAECIAIADFIAAIEAEKRAQDGSQSRAGAAVAATANGAGSHGSGPQRIMP